MSTDEYVKPSDLQDPKKLELFNQLARKIWKFREHTSLSDHDISSKLLKILTPPDDYNDYLNNKSKKKNIFASSSFYSSALHPTVEDQINLARKISQSLSDIGNRQSRGQSMYVNRKKRSAKWVHEGVPRSASETFQTNYESNNDNDQHHDRPFLELIMDPRGHVQDINSLKKQGIPVEHSSISPELCLELVKDLNSPSGKGAELFAKRRKKSEKWITDETSGSNESSQQTNFDSLRSSDNENQSINQMKTNQLTIQQNTDNNFCPKTYEFLQKIPKTGTLSVRNNFNTAPRGWNQNLTVYHPIKFDTCNSIKNRKTIGSPITFHHLLYTDY